MLHLHSLHGPGRIPHLLHEVVDRAAEVTHRRIGAFLDIADPCPGIAGGTLFACEAIGVTQRVHARDARHAVAHLKTRAATVAATDHLALRSLRIPEEVGLDAVDGENEATKLVVAGGRHEEISALDREHVDTAAIHRDVDVVHVVERKLAELAHIARGRAVHAHRTLQMDQRKVVHEAPVIEAPGAIDIVRIADLRLRAPVAVQLHIGRHAHGGSVEAMRRADGPAVGEQARAAAATIGSHLQQP